MPQGVEVQVLSWAHSSFFGRLAQLVERPVYIRQVGGSSPSAATQIFNEI